MCDFDPLNLRKILGNFPEISENKRVTWNWKISWKFSARVALLFALLCQIK